MNIFTIIVEIFAILVEIYTILAEIFTIIVEKYTCTIMRDATNGASYHSDEALDHKLMNFITSTRGRHSPVVFDLFGLWVSRRKWCSIGPRGG